MFPRSWSSPIRTFHDLEYENIHLVLACLSILPIHPDPRQPHYPPKVDTLGRKP